MLADRLGLLASLGDEELPARPDAQRAGELAQVGRLREGVAEHLVDVGFAVAVGVPEPPDAVAVEGEEFVVADRQGHGLMEP